MARLTKKSYKRKRIAIGLSLFASTALVSTGFAAWIVSSQANAEGNGSVSIGQIKDAALKIEIENADNVGKFSFGPLAEDNRGLVKFDDTDGESENLTITINGTFENAQYLNNLTIRMDEVTTSRIVKAVQEGYLVENGKITKPVKGATLIGNGSKILFNIDMIANNLKREQGMCGSSSGSIPADVGQPTIRVKSILVGGTGGKI